MKMNALFALVCLNLIIMQGNSFFNSLNAKIQFYSLVSNILRSTIERTMKILREKKYQKLEFLTKNLMQKVLSINSLYSKVNSYGENFMRLKNFLRIDAIEISFKNSSETHMRIVTE